MQNFSDFYTNMFERLGRFSNRFSTRMCVTGPLKLKTLEPLKRDLEICKHALTETGASEGFFCITAPVWTVADAGVLLQIDDPAISHDWEEVRRPQMTLAEYERFMMVRIEALNAALAGIPEDMVRPTSSSTLR
jgi:hypothetical protein